MNDCRNMGETFEGAASCGALDLNNSNRMEPKPMNNETQTNNTSCKDKTGCKDACVGVQVKRVKTIEDLVEYFADHGEVIHTEGECVYAIDYYVECAFDDKEEFIRLFIQDATSEQLFMVRRIIEKSFSASDALDKFQLYFEDELQEMLHEALIHEAGN